jgi:tetratricopeptide (TPR) repeat protein
MKLNPFVPQRRAARALSVTSVAVLAACAMPPLAPDLQAGAPTLEGFGQLDITISSSSSAARKRFNEGVLQAYAFNETEAVRMFKAALALDPSCAMCAWGVAWQLGPNINAPQRGDLKEATRYVDHALRHSASATPREKALIELMALRYGHSSQERALGPLAGEVCASKGRSSPAAHPLDIAYAERLYKMVQATPLDAELVSLWAEAELVATRDDWWDDKTGQPAGRIGELATALETALVRHPEHTGLNHYLIHTVDARPVAQRAVAAADRLGKLAPMSPHLVHMPSHTYAHVGRYADATRVNQLAMEAEARIGQLQKDQGFAVSKDWSGHNLHFQWWGALMEGRGDLALQTARQLAARAAGTHIYHEYQRSLPVLTLLRLQRWDSLLAEAVPTGTQGLAQALHGHAVAVAQARSGRLPQAKQALAAIEQAAKTVAKAHTGKDGFDQALRGMAEGAVARLRAEIALAEGRHAEAQTLQEQAVKDWSHADDNEPPMLAGSARVALAQLQARAGQHAAAEKTWREDLAAWPGSGWALAGLSQALQAQGRNDEAAAQQRELDRAWPLADGALKATVRVTP